VYAEYILLEQKQQLVGVDLLMVPLSLGAVLQWKSVKHFIVCCVLSLN
jgi:hypothetical protein